MRNIALSVLLCLALVLSACGGGGAFGPSADTSRIVVIESQATNGFAGWTQWGDGPTEVRIFPEDADGFFTSFDKRAAIIAHELWHAMTLRSEHSENADCISRFPVRIGLLREMRACQEDVESIPPRTWTISAGPFLEETRAAIHYWNAALGREALVLED